MKRDPRHVRILVTRDFPRVGIDLLKSEGFQVTEWPKERPMTPAELQEMTLLHHALYCASSDKLDAAFLRACSHLEIISQFAAGYDNIDMAVANELRIPIANAPGAMKEATADVAFGLMIAVSRKMFFNHKRILRKQWGNFRPQEHLGMELTGRTLGIFGLGQIGEEMARRCQGAYGMRIIYHNRSRNVQAEGRLGAAYVSFDELLSQSDVLSVHCALSDDTRGRFDRTAFQRMKPTSIFLNTARGPVHVEQDLITALRNGEIWGAGLDVSDPEPMDPNNPLLEMENVCVLPHIGSATVEARNRMSEFAAHNIISFYRGNSVPHLVNSKIFD